MTDDRRPPLRIRRVELEGDYAGWWVDLRLNIPMARLEDLSSGDILGRILPSLARICQNSNYVDDDGLAIDVTKPEDWKRVPYDLVVLTARKFNEAMRDPFGPPASPPSPTSSDTPTSPPQDSA